MALAIHSQNSSLPTIRGLLSGVQWVGTLTYSDPDRAADYGFRYPGETASLQNFSPLRPDQMAVVHHALNARGPGVTRPEAAFTVSGLTGLEIAYQGNSPLADVRVANSRDAETAFAYFPAGGAGGDIWFGNAGIRDLRPGSYGHSTILHEVGHAVGLKHPHEPPPILPRAFDHLEFTVMTYRSFEGSGFADDEIDPWSFAQTFMIGDIAALQHLYGANYTTNAGNSVYSWTPRGGDLRIDGAIAVSPGANRIFQTIWDGGGIDAYDASAYTTNVKLDLTPGESSILARAQLAFLGGGTNGGSARGNVYNALQHEADLRSLIENALGGAGNDLLIGNVASNSLVGRAGHDRIQGGAGNDRLLGGEGNDRLAGEAGDDLLFGDAGHDHLNGGAGADRMTGGEGNDLYFVDDLGDVVIETRGAPGGIDLVYSGLRILRPENVERIVYTGAAEERAGRGQNIAGSDAADGLAGTRFADRMNGQGGDDDLRGGKGADLIAGGDGRDIVFGGAGSDRILGGSGADRISGGAGNDRMNGEAGDDRLRGDAGNDQLYGDAGADILSGGSGRDLLTGGDTRDILFGGGGADTFAFNAASQSVHGAADAIIGSRTLLAFEGIGAAGGDRIDLRAIDADLTLAGNQAFAFGRGDGTAGRAWVGEKRGGASVVLANLDDDPAYDLEIHIADGAVRADAYSALDFLL